MLTVAQDRFRLRQAFTISRGGRTGALATVAEARAMGFGTMVGSSLAAAPAVLAAQGAAYADLDGPLLLAEDRDAALVYDDRGVHPPEAELWG